MVCHFLTYIYFNVILKSFREGCLFLIYRVARQGRAGVTLQLLQFKITLWGWVVQWGNGTVTL